MANVANLNLPIPVVNVTGWEDTSSIFGGVSVTLPVPYARALGTTVANTNRVGAVELVYIPFADIDIHGTSADRAICLVTLPTLSLNSSGVVSQLVGVNLALPALSLSCNGTISSFAEIALTLPSHTVVIEGGYSEVPLALSKPTLAVTGMLGLSAPVAILFPKLDIDVSGFIEILGNVSLALPTLQIALHSPNDVHLTIATPVIATTGAEGCIGGVSINNVHPALSSIGSVPYTGNIALSTSRTIAVDGVTGIAGNITASLRRIALAINGQSGTVGNASIVLPAFRQTADGYQAITGNIIVSIPTLVLTSNGYKAAGASFSTIVMHTENQALSTYTNYNFNSFTSFNGVYLAANGSGIFALSGATDDGAIIEASARAGITDFGTSHLKRVDRMYVGYRASGDMVLKVFTDEVNAREYLLSATGKAGIHGNHVRIGKGLAARYWQFEIGNRNGSDFELNIIEVKPTVLRRRIGGNDA